MILILLFCFFIFLYVLYYVSRDDFVIVRKDVPMGKIFSLAFLTCFVALFFSRLAFVLIHPDPKLLNPLGFLALPYFPGLSLMGGVASAELFILMWANYKKMPVGKILDLFAFAFIAVTPLGYIGNFLIHLGKVSLFDNVFLIVSILVLMLFIKIIYPFSNKGEIKDGSLALIFTAILSFLYFLINLFLNLKSFSFLSVDNILVLVVLFSSLILLVNQEIMDKFLFKK
jgi:prolipoprotein diacylglyceryltransferase